jgi:hypothetical protein
MLNFFSIYGLGAFGLLLFPVIAIVFIFEIFMIVSAITNDRIDDTRKILWVIGMLIVHPFIAIAYFFTDYKKTR